MRLREQQVFIKLTTRQDLLHDGQYLGMLAEVESLLGHGLPWFRDLGARRAALRREAGGEAELLSFRGHGLQQCGRLVVAGDEAMRGASLALNALSHPYSGAHVTHVEVRIPHEDLEREGACEALVAMAERWMAEFEALCAHVHDADDHAIQNTGSEGMLRSGYGVDPAQMEALEARPGREWSRGEFRLGATWMTWIGDELLALLGEDVVNADVLPSKALAGGRVYRLSEDPRECDAMVRDAQRRLRDGLGLREAASRLRRNFGYWQRRG